MLQYITVLTMTEEIDKKALLNEVREIREAMGLHESYPSQAKSWVLWGVLVGIAGILTQIVALKKLPGYYVGTIWIGLMFGIGMPLQIKITNPDESKRPQTGTKPSFGILTVAIFATAFLLAFNVGTLLKNVDYYESGAYIASTIIAMVGTYYILSGNQLKAYYVRKKDRYSLYIGGMWVLGLSLVLPHFHLLARWCYGIYGISFLVYSLTAYYLTKE